jgi:hypothetical protein
MSMHKADWKALGEKIVQWVKDHPIPSVVIAVVATSLLSAIFWNIVK